MDTPEVISREVIAEGAHLRLIRLTCRKRDGSTYAWEAVERPATTRNVVAAFPVADDRRVICVEQFRPPVGTRVLELPAGLCDRDGESLEAAALRELGEETGRTGEIVCEVPLSAESSGTIVGHLHIFLAHVTGHTAVARDVAEEFMAPRVVELPLDGLLDAIRAYAIAHPGHLVDPKIVACFAWWQHIQGGGQ